MPAIKYLWVLGLALLLPWPVASQAAGDVEAGFLFHEFPLTLAEGHRSEALGPLFSYERREHELLSAIPPLVARVENDETDFTEIDVLYPLLTYDRFGTEYRFQILQIFSFAGGQTMEEVEKKRFTLFPFYFQQRSTDPKLNYTALLPFYGHLQNRLFRDEIKFILFPLYGQSRKRDVVTDNYLFPVFHLRRGNALHGWQVWPLVGFEHKDPTTKTNGFGEVEVVGGHDKFMALWPFYFHNNLGIGTDNPQKVRIFLPLYSLLRSPQRDSSTYLWPFGFTYTEDREKKYREWGAPWPLIVFARGEGKTANRVWPLFGHAHNASQQSDFYLWPLYKYNRLQSAPLDRERTRILFFLYSDVIERNTEKGTARQRTDFWPLFTAKRDFDGNERLQLFAPLEPLLPGNKSIERSYSPLWSIWRSEKNGKTGATSQSLLWNLYRRDTTPTTRKGSLLFGLFRYETGPEGRRYRLFYVPLGGTKKTAAQPTAPATESP
ncbi:MAG: hypothetical protein AB1705_08300 [Verrucomicrobiota bacterium]